MARTQAKKRLIIASIALAVVLLIAGGIALAKRNETAQTPTSPAISAKPDVAETSNPEDSSTDAAEVVMADPETLSSVDVEPLSVTVYYTKGVPAFGFEVKRTADSTQYAEFSSDELIGTKCTNDTGLFATIIKDPSTTDEAILSQTVKVGETPYGLSLAGMGCTADAELLAQYQAAFKEGFTSLKAL